MEIGKIGKTLEYGNRENRKPEGVVDDKQFRRMEFTVRTLQKHVKMG